MTYLAKHGATEEDSEIVYHIPSVLYHYIFSSNSAFFFQIILRIIFLVSEQFKKHGGLCSSWQDQSSFSQRLGLAG